MSDVQPEQWGELIEGPPSIGWVVHLVQRTHETDQIVWAWCKVGVDEPGYKEIVFCLAPETRVLTADLRWVPVGSLVLGDGLAGFDEFSPGGSHGHRLWRRAAVTGTGRVMQSSYRVELANGTSIVCSEAHKWLMSKNGVDRPGRWTTGGRQSTSGSNKRWCTTLELFDAQTNPVRDPATGRFNLRLDKMAAVRLLDVWETEHSRDGGYVAGVFDGEGCWNRRYASMAQRDNSVLRDTVDALAFCGFGSLISRRSVGKNKDVVQLTIKGGVPESLRLLGQVRPQRLIDNFLAAGGFETLGRLTTLERVPIRRVVPVGLTEVVALSTSTQTVVAEGFAHHNTRSDGSTPADPGPGNLILGDVIVRLWC